MRERERGKWKKSKKGDRVDGWWGYFQNSLIMGGWCGPMSHVLCTRQTFPSNLKGNLDGGVIGHVFESNWGVNYYNRKFGGWGDIEK